jgi:hypothetical protein
LAVPAVHKERMNDMKAGRKEKTAIDDTRIRAKVRKRAKK